VNTTPITRVVSALFTDRDGESFRGHMRKFILPRGGIPREPGPATNARDERRDRCATTVQTVASYSGIGRTVVTASKRAAALHAKELNNHHNKKESD
jgi:hypothetical protein